ncbi:MAG: hypothetical protein ACTSR3_17420 [Candidatus Helarchaeota archaeon]
MGKDLIAGGAVLGALIIVVLDAIIGVGASLRYWADMADRTSLTFAMGIAYYMRFPVNVYISIIICAFAGLCAGATAKSPLYGTIAGVGAYIGSILGILIIAGMGSTVFPPMFGIGAFLPSDLAAVVAMSFVWGIWLVIGMAIVGGLLSKQGEGRG